MTSCVIQSKGLNKRVQHLHWCFRMNLCLSYDTIHHNLMRMGLQTGQGAHTDPTPPAGQCRLCTGQFRTRWDSWLDKVKLTSARASADSGVSSAGLTTTVQPAARAAPTFLVIMALGKFHCETVWQHLLNQHSFNFFTSPEDTEEGFFFTAVRTAVPNFFGFLSFKTKQHLVKTPHLVHNFSGLS